MKKRDKLQGVRCLFALLLSSHEFAHLHAHSPVPGRAIRRTVSPCPLSPMRKARLSAYSRAAMHRLPDWPAETAVGAVLGSGTGNRTEAPRLPWLRPPRRTPTEWGCRRCPSRWSTSPALRKGPSSLSLALRRCSGLHNAANRMRPALVRYAGGGFSRLVCLSCLLTGRRHGSDD